MGLVFLVVVGITLGWLAAIVVRADNAPGLLRNGAIGIGGALIAGLVVSPLVARGDLLHGAYSVETLVISLAGTALLLCAANLLPRRHNRTAPRDPNRRRALYPAGRETGHRHA